MLRIRQEDDEEERNMGRLKCRTGKWATNEGLLRSKSDRHDCKMRDQIYRVPQTWHHWFCIFWSCIFRAPRNISWSWRLDAATAGVIAVTAQQDVCRRITVKHRTLGVIARNSREQCWHLV